MCVDRMCSHLVISPRTVLQQQLTLHDGFRLDRGARIAFPAQSIHSDPENYQDAHKFIGFRFAGSGPCKCEPAPQQTTVDNGRLKAEAIDEKYLP